MNQPPYLPNAAHSPFPRYLIETYDRNIAHTVLCQLSSTIFPSLLLPPPKETHARTIVLTLPHNDILNMLTTPPVPHTILLFSK